MDLFQQNLRLNLVRPDLNALPVASLPPGYSWRWFQPGDAAHWLHIHHDADPLNDITPDLFTRQFGVDFAQLSGRQLFVADAIGRVVGTGTAWPETVCGKDACGRVAWLAVLRQFQGRGLGKSLLAATCARLREFGCAHACVVTSTGRLRAVNLYLQFGFRPELHTAEDQAVWDQVFSALQTRGHWHTAAVMPSVPFRQTPLRAA
jgi:GNAT superfamily N-acetyltransferase